MKRVCKLRPPFAIAVHPAIGREPSAVVWADEPTRDLVRYIEDEIVSLEDVLVVVARDLPIVDLAHVLRQVADLVERRALREPPFAADLRPRCGTTRALARSA